MSTRGMALEEMGRRAARDFLERQTPLNDSVLKLAAAEGLGDEAVKRVCETANVTVDANLFDSFQKAAMAGSGELFYPKFQLADASFINRQLSGLPKVASVEDRICDDYDRPPVLEIRTAYDPVLEAAFEKAATVEPPTVQRPEIALEKFAALRSEVLMGKAGAEMKRDEAAADCYRHIKQQVLDGADIKNLYRAAVGKQKTEAGKNRVQDVFNLAANKLVDEGVRITADRQGAKLAHPGLSSEDRAKYITDCWETPEGAGQVLVLNGSYVNDTAPLFALLDTTVRQQDEADRYDKALIVIDDKQKYLKSKIHGLMLGGA